MNRFSLETDVQMAPMSLPALSAGSNQVLYTDETEKSRRVEITHRWD